MPAYIIVEINIHEPAGYEEYKEPKCLKAIGHRSASWFFNSNQPTAPRSG